MTKKVRPAVVSIDAAAALLGLTPVTVRRAVRRGQVPGVRVGKKYLVSRAGLEKLVAGEAPQRAAQA